MYIKAAHDQRIILPLLNRNVTESAVKNKPSIHHKMQNIHNI